MKSLLSSSGCVLFLFHGQLTLIIMACVFIGAACSNENDSKTVASDFVLTSPEIGQDSLLPQEYTCDGESASLPLAWSGAPEGTKYYALIMHHEASPTDIHWYWVLYNIPPSVNSLVKNATGIGSQGTNSVNGMTEYAPPCSQGPGPKMYVITLYALSDSARISAPASRVNREVLLNAIQDITLAEASLKVVYSRTVH